MEVYSAIAIGIVILLFSSFTMGFIDTWRESKGKKPFLDM